MSEEPARPPQQPPQGPHLLDATMFWPASGVGGVRRVIGAKAAGLVERGWRHTLLAPGAAGAGCVDCGGLPIPGGGGYRFVCRPGHASRLMQAARPDLIEAADPYVLGHAALDAARRLGVPAVAFCHSDLPALAARLGDERGAVSRWALRQAARYLAVLYRRYDVVLAPSRWMAERLRGWGVAHAECQPLGVDCELFSPHAFEPAWRRRLEAGLGLPPGTRLLVYAGRFAPEKNLQVLAGAVQRLGRGHALLAIGAGPTPPQGERVYRLTPARDPRRLAALLASGDVFVHAGDQETFGLAALEAMACGTPVVASAFAGLGELVTGAGLTVASSRPADWAEAIAQTLRQPDTARLRRARELAQAHRWPLVIEQLAQRYRRALGRHARGAAGPRPLHAEPPLSPR